MSNSYYIVYNELTSKDMNSSIPLQAINLNLIQTYLTRYVMVPFYIFGNFSNLVNIILFSRRNFRKRNVCAWYLISLSMANLLIIDTGGLSRSLPYLTDFNLETTSVIFCKCRLYFVHCSLLLWRYFICLISIDRCMITSSRQSIRRMSSPIIARYLIIVGTCICVIFSIHAPMGFLIKSNRCYAYLSTGYGIFYSVYNLLCVVIPIFIMILFSALTMINIRQSRHRTQQISREVTSLQQNPVRAIQQGDMQLIRLSLLQSLTFTVFNIGLVVFTFYDFVTSTETKSAYQQLIEIFIYTITIHCIYIFCSVR